MSSPADDPLPDDIETLKALLLAERSARQAAEKLTKLRDLEIEKLRHRIAKLQHERFGQSSERRALLGQLELQLFELEEDQAQSKATAEIAAPQTQTVRSFERSKPARRPLPEHLPRERVVYPAPTACPCCGGALHKLGEDITESLELAPRQLKVAQHVRQKFSCRLCEKISQPPAPSYPIARGRAGPGRLAHVLFAKYGLHLPLTRQSATYAREGVELDVSTLADWVGPSAATLTPLVEAIGACVFSGPVSMPTIPRCRCSPPGARAPAGCGSMRATTGRLAASIRRQRFTSTRPIGRQASRGASGLLQRADAGRRLCRPRSDLRAQTTLMAGCEDTPSITRSAWRKCSRRRAIVHQLHCVILAALAPKRVVRDRRDLVRPRLGLRPRPGATSHRLSIQSAA